MKKILTVAIAMLLALSLLMGSACAFVSNAEREAFKEIFKSRSLVHSFDFDVPGPGEYGSIYAGVLANGIVDVHEYAAKSKDICMFEMVNTMYYPFIGLSSAERTVLENDIRATFAAIDAEKFVEVTYSMQNDYFVIRIHYKDLDKKKNVRILGEYGVVPEGTEAISYSDTIRDRKNSGYLEGDMMAAFDF